MALVTTTRVAACLQMLLSLQSLLSIPAEVVCCCVARPLPQLCPIHQLLSLLLLTRRWQGRATVAAEHKRQGRVTVAAEHKRQLRDRETLSCFMKGRRAKSAAAVWDRQATPSRPPSTNKDSSRIH